MIHLSVVIPAFNEASRIRPTLEKVSGWLASKKFSSEIIVVDDGSSDSTAGVAAVFQKDAGTQTAGTQKRPSLRVIKNDRNRGKGFSVRRGMLAAEGELILFSDADLSTPIEDFDVLAEALAKENADVAVGSRVVSGAQITVHQPFYRELMGKIFNKIARMLTFKKIKDSQCGFKLFRRAAARELFSRATIDRFAFDVEIIFLAQKKGFRVVEVPVRWANNPNTRVSALRDSAAMFREVVRIRANYLMRKYE